MENSESFHEHYAEYISALNNTFNETDHNLDILHPDNPLMSRFQNALKNLLEKQLCRLSQDLLQLERNIKLLGNEKYNISEIIFNEEEQIKKQQILFDEVRESISNVIIMKEKIDRDMCELRNKFDEERSETELLYNENNNLGEKLNFLNLVICKLNDNSNNKESHLLVTRRMMEKNDRDKRTMLNEKEMQDIVLMKLEKNLMDLETVRRNLNSKLAKCNAVLTYDGDIDDKTTMILKPDKMEFTLSEENAQLLIYWRDIINAINDRDEAYFKATIELTNLENRRKEREIEIKTVKNDIRSIIVKGDRLIIDECKMKKRYDTLTNERIRLTDEIETIKNSLNELTLIVENTRKNFERISSEKVNVASELTVIRNVTKKLKLENRDLEEMLFYQWQEQIVKNADAIGIDTNIKRTQDKIREYEQLLSCYDGEYSTILSNLANAEDRRKIFYDHLDSVKSDELSKRATINDHRAQLERMKKTQTKLNVLLAGQNKQLNNLLEKVPTHAEIRTEINVIRKNLHNLTNDDNESKRKWIRQQNEIINIVRLKEDQIRKTALMKNQMFVFEYKKINLERRLCQTEEFEIGNTNKRITGLIKAISKINCRYDEEKKLKEILNRDGITIYNRYLSNLKDDEEATLQLAKEIENLETSKKDGYQKFLELQQEDLSLENKIKMAANIRSEILKEKSMHGGGIGHIKVEIHNMQIRYTQLKKVQDKLSVDLQMCVGRRDDIMNGTLFENKKDKGNYFEETFSRKLDCLNNKILKTARDIKKLEDKYSALCDDIAEKEMNQINYVDEKELLQKNLRTLSSTFNSVYIEKYKKNLELNIYKQRKLNYLFQAKNGSYIALYRSTGALETEYLKQSCLNSNLRSIIEALNNDFPLYQEDMSKISHFLNVDSL